MWASKSSPFRNEKPFETIISKIWKEETLIKSLSVLHHSLVALLDTSIVHPEGKLTFKRVLPHIWIDYVTRAMPSEQVCIFKNMKWLLEKRRSIIHSPQKKQPKTGFSTEWWMFLWCQKHSTTLPAFSNRHFPIVGITEIEVQVPE